MRKILWRMLMSDRRLIRLIAAKIVILVMSAK